MVSFAHSLILFVSLSNPVFSSITPSDALTGTGCSISAVATNQLSSSVEWDKKTNEFIQKYQNLRQLHDSLLRDYEPEARSQSGILSPPSENRMDYKAERYCWSRSDMTSSGRATPTSKGKHESELLLRLKRIDERLKKIVPEDGTMKYEGKRVYTTDELRHIESKVKELKNGFDYIYLGDGKFVRIEEQESCDLSGMFGQIRAFDEDGKTILYQTDCCYWNWNSFSPGESSFLEHVVWITACLPLKAVYHFTEETWKRFEAKFLDGLMGLC